MCYIYIDKADKGKKAFNCNACVKAFNKKQPFNCNICDKAFKGKKPFICKICEKNLLNFNALHLHRQS